MERIAIWLCSCKINCCIASKCVKFIREVWIEDNRQPTCSKLGGLYGQLLNCSLASGCCQRPVRVMLSTGGLSWVVVRVGSC